MPLQLYWCLQDLVTITTNHVYQDSNHATQLFPGLRLEICSLPILTVVRMRRICLKVKELFPLIVSLTHVIISKPRFFKQRYLLKRFLLLYSVIYTDNKDCL